jgi:hypothetical protein
VLYAFIERWQNIENMTDVGVKRLILVTALETEVQGMIAANEQNANEGFSQAYDKEHFDFIASKMLEIAHMNDDQVMSVC